MEFLNWDTEDLSIRAKSLLYYEEQHSGIYILRAFQQDRCAICGYKDDLQMDHCHESGLIRGLLCRSCNVGEGKSNHPKYVAYRKVYPTKILGLKIPYRLYVSGYPPPPYFGEFELDVRTWSNEKCYKIVKKMTESYLVSLDWLNEEEFSDVLSKALLFGIQTKGA